MRTPTPRITEFIVIETYTKPPQDVDFSILIDMWLNKEAILYCFDSVRTLKQWEKKPLVKTKRFLLAKPRVAYRRISNLNEKNPKYEHIWSKLEVADTSLQTKQAKQKIRKKRLDFWEEKKKND